MLAGDFHVLPPDIAVIGQDAVGEDGILLDAFHRHGVGLVARARGNAEEPGFRVDRMQTPVRPDLHPGNVVANAFALPTRNRGLEHGQVGFAAGAGKRSGNVEALALGIGQAQDEHVLGHPAFAACHGGGNAQRQTLLAQQSVAAVPGTVRPDKVLFGEMGYVLLLDRCARPGHVLLSGLQRRAHRMYARNELAVLAKHGNNVVTDARHDVHVHHNIGRIGNLNTDL